MAIWTTKTVEAATRKAKKDERDVWLTEARPRGEGRLRLRARPNGHALLYFRYSLAGVQRQIDLGSYDESGRAGLTLAAARERTGELAKLYQSGVRDLHGHLEHERAAQKALIEAAARERAEAERQATAGSLQALCDGYVQHLEAQGKQSARDAANIFKLHVSEAFPAVACRRAADVSRSDISAMLARLINDPKKKGRTAVKLRAYLRAAYAAALAASDDPTIHPKLHDFNLAANPVALVPAKNLAKQYNRARERDLKAPELAAFLAALADKPGIATNAIVLALYLGGQRFAQLLRLQPKDVDLDRSTVTLYDGKGQRARPRTHLLPLTAPALTIVKQLLAANGDKAFLITNGRVPVRVETLSKLVKETSDAMVKDKKASERFQMSDLRRTCETMLASMRISKDIRAQILSHGLGGVQDRHYDRHLYLPEKQAALEAWARRLEEITKGEAQTNVVALSPRV